MRFLVLIWLAIAAPLQAESPIRVIAAHTVLVDLVRQVGGDLVEVNGLIPPNVDLHSYEPKPSQMALLSSPELVVLNGLGLEPWSQKMIANSDFRGPVLKLGESSPRLLLRNGSTEEKGESSYDPHAWQSIENVEAYARLIGEALARLRPAQASLLRAQTERYEAELRQLADYAKTEFATIPPRQKVLVTSHDSLRYLADEYGFSIVTIAGLQPDREPGTRDLADLIRLIRGRHAPAIFLEATASPKLSQMIAEEAGVAVVAELYTDSLGLAGSPADTYVKMYRSNVNVIVRSLK